jgi:sorbitol-specific phosphotransferase system component IIA
MCHVEVISIIPKHSEQHQMVILHFDKSSLKLSRFLYACQHTKLQERILDGASIPLNYQVRTVALLLSVIRRR